MKIRMLSTALLAGLAFAQVASAQEFDDRWYLTGSAGMNIQDNDRGTRNAPFGALGVGKFLSQNWSLDGELNYQNPNNDANQDLQLEPVRHLVRPASPLHRRRPQLGAVPADGPGLPAVGRRVRRLPEPELAGRA